MLAFTYVVVTVLIALSIPLLVSLRARARNDVEKNTLSFVQAVAGFLDGESLKQGQWLSNHVASWAAAEQGGGRVIVMDEHGNVLADSASQAVGQNYNNGLRPEITAALDKGNPTATSSTRYSTTLKAELLAAAAPVFDQGRLVGAVRLTKNIQAVNDAVRSTTISVIALIGGAGLLVGLVIAFAMSGSLAKPLTRLASTAHQLGTGDLSARAGTVEGADEVRELARSFDDMADRVERTVQAQREFVANASHQLRTPLTGMKLRLETAFTEAPTPELKAQLVAADQEVDRLAATVDRLLVMSRKLEEGEPTSVELHGAAERAIERWNERAAQHASALSSSGTATLAEANPTDVDQIFDNLIENAIRYAPGPIEIQTGTAERRSFLAVRDHGRGIPPEEREKVTERFFRGKTAPPGGSGLGLAIARELAERWGGGLSVRSADGGGARIEVRFRVVSGPSPNGKTGAAGGPRAEP